MAGIFGPMMGGQVPVLDSRQMVGPPRALFDPLGDAQAQRAAQLRQMYPDPRQQSIGSMLGSAILPMLLGKIAGGSGRESALYGIGSAAHNFNSQLANYNEIEANIANAAAQLPKARTDLAEVEAKANLQNAQAIALMTPQEAAKKYTKIELAHPNDQRKAQIWMVNEGDQNDRFLVGDAPFDASKGAGGPPSYTYNVEPDDTSPTGFSNVARDSHNPTAPAITVGPATTPASEARNIQDAADSIGASVQAIAAIPAQQTNVNATLDRALKLTNAWSTGWGAATFGKLSPTQAGQLKAEVLSINGVLGKDALQSIRAQAQNGASGFGQLTEKELALIQSLVTNLNPEKGAKAFRDDLAKIRESFGRAAFYAALGNQIAMYNKTNSIPAGVRAHRGLPDPAAPDLGFAARAAGISPGQAMTYLADIPPQFRKMITMPASRSPVGGQQQQQAVIAPPGAAPQGASVQPGDIIPPGQAPARMSAMDYINAGKGSR